ncbi:cytidine deaminase [Streptomyces sp. NBC_01142]|uniref:cytidine deaminase family protein n=1 Tax=Streptomyces sp. NBC_01142 TaxID=2975865 RepID=UPI002253258C|nr:cytidine deaminase [Streptomyces sp. NBC_01142]MCX4818971.1 cytidine deaminase [Streptomyces sp. NBC_01142]
MGRRQVASRHVTIDQELVDVATRLVATRAKGDDHTVAAAARNRDGRVVTGLNVYHFTGGPCAELVVIGAAAGEGAYELTTIVAVADDDRGVLSPCGRCRQVLLDYFPEIEVIVATEEHGLRAVSVQELLPYGYRCSEHP